MYKRQGLDCFGAGDFATTIVSYIHSLGVVTKYGVPRLDSTVLSFDFDRAQVSRSRMALQFSFTGELHIQSKGADTFESGVTVIENAAHTIAPYAPDMVEFGTMLVTPVEPVMVFDLAEESVADGSNVEFSL